MDFFYWLLARCQQAVWGTEELKQAFVSKDMNALLALDLKTARRDIFFLFVALVFGYGPLLG